MNVRTTLKNHPYLAALVWIFAILLVMMLATGCTTKASSPSVDAPAAKPVAETPEAVEEPAVDPMLVSFGEVFTWEDGVSMSVSAPTPFTPTEYAAGAVPGNTNLVFSVNVTNGSDTTYSPSIWETVSSGGAEASMISDIDNPIGEISWGPTTAMLPGDTVTWLVAYSVADPAAILFETSPGFAYEYALFTNRLP